MSIRVAHLTGLWQAGAGAVVRIHEGLRGCGVDSRLFSASPIDSTISASFTLPPIASQRSRAWWRRRRDSSAWPQRIERASRSNAVFEAFTPPAAIEPVDLSPVLRDVDVLHLHWVGAYLDYQAFFRNVHLPVVWTLHDQHPYLGGFHYQGDVDAATAMLPLEYECRDLKREALADLHLTAVGNSIWNESQAMATGVLPAHTRFSQIYLPLPTDEYVPLPKSTCKKGLGVEPDRFVVGFACAAMGNRRKGFVDLVAALERLPSAIKANLTLVSFGYQPSKELRQRVSVPWIHLGRPHGGQQQSPIYSAMDAFVIPSLEEAFGQTALEALACETPVIGTRVGGIPEMVEDEVTGLLAPPRSPHRLAECITRLHDEPRLRTECGIRGRRLAVKRHDSAVIARCYEALYRDVLDSATASRTKSSVRAA